MELVPYDKMLRISVRGGKNPSKVSSVCGRGSCFRCLTITFFWCLLIGSENVSGDVWTTGIEVVQHQVIQAHHPLRPLLVKWANIERPLFVLFRRLRKVRYLFSPTHSLLSFFLLSLSVCSPTNELHREASLGSSSMMCMKENIPIRLDQLVPDVVLSDLESRRIDFSTVQIDKELAKGGFGIVYKVIEGGEAREEGSRSE